MTEIEIKARLCLANGGYLSDPRYAIERNRSIREEELKHVCRLCYALRAHFPDWVLAYMGRWSAAAAKGGPKFEEPLK